MSEIERIPSTHKKPRPPAPRKGTRQTRQMAVPAPAPELELGLAAELAPGLGLAADPASPPEPERQPAPDLEPQPQFDPQLEPQPVSAPEPEALIPPAPEPPPATSETASQAPPAYEPAQEVEPLPRLVTMRDMLGRVDAAWYAFRAAAVRLPAERMDEHLDDAGWTRKQMLAHVAAWHDLTADQLVKLALTGRPTPVERDVDAINAGVARIALGKTAGEVLKDVESTFSRLRRRMLNLSDAQLRLGDAWAAQVIADNTYAHYAEHMADLFIPEPAEGTQRR